MKWPVPFVCVSLLLEMFCMNGFAQPCVFQREADLYQIAIKMCEYKVRRCSTTPWSWFISLVWVHWFSPMAIVV